MDVAAITAQLDAFTAKLFVKTQYGTEPAAPADLSKNLLLIRGLMIRLVDQIAVIERDYRHSKASKFDELIKAGTKKSPAMDLLELDKELIDKKIETERLKGYLKYVDGLCTSVQSVLKFQTSADKSQY